MPVGEGVDLPVQNDTSIYLSPIAFDASSFYEIGDEVAEHDRFGIAGEIKMSQKIHILRVKPTGEMIAITGSFTEVQLVDIVLEAASAFISGSDKTPAV